MNDVITTWHFDVEFMHFSVEISVRIYAKDDLISQFRKAIKKYLMRLKNIAHCKCFKIDTEAK